MLSQGEENLILSAFHILQHEVNLNARNHGFWPSEPNEEINSGGRNDGEMIALMHSELSEALEAIRKPKQDEHCPEFQSIEIELADCIIRILDYADARRLRLGEALLAKHRFNITREFKHGKAF